MYKFSTADEMWIHAINSCVNTNSLRDSRVGLMYESIGWQATLTNVNENFVLNTARCASPIYAAAEFIWYMSLSDDGSLIKAYAPSYERFLEDNGHAHGAYGARWRNQISWLKAHLQKDPNTRQAVLTCWDFGGHADLIHAFFASKRDLPCTISLQFLIRDSQLHLIATMRSNDVWLGMPYDIFCFTTLQKILAAELNCECGTYTHQVGSMHLYKKDRSRAEYAFDGLYKSPCEGRIASYEDAAYLPQLIEFERLIREGNPPQVALNPLALGDSGKLMPTLLALVIRKWRPELSTEVDRHIDPYLLPAVKRLDSK